jgi:hypothetical protein
MALDVGQAHVAACVRKSQPFVIQAEQVQYRGVPVVDMHRVDDALIAELVGLTMAGTGLDA